MRARFKQGRRHCIVTELLGSDLYGFMRAKSFIRFRPDQFRSLAFQIVSAVKCMNDCLKGFVTDHVGLHEHGIAHGDLKPENIALLEDEVYFAVSTD